MKSEGKYWSAKQVLEILPNSWRKFPFGAVSGIHLQTVAFELRLCFVF